MLSQKRPRTTEGCTSETQTTVPDVSKLVGTLYARSFYCLENTDELACMTLNEAKFQNQIKRSDPTATLSCLGSGSFATVFKVVIAEQTSVAIKVAKQQRITVGHDHSCLSNEETAIKCLFGDHHRQTREVVGIQAIKLCYTMDGIPLQIMSIADCTLFAYRQQCDRAHLGRFLNKMMQQLVFGLAHVHQIDMVHGDVSISNILVTSQGSDACPFVRWSDFGSSYHTAVCPEEREQGGTVVFFSPEQILQYSEEIELPHVTQASEIWSLGCVARFVTSNRIPFFESGSSAFICVFLEHCKLLGLPDFTLASQNWKDLADVLPRFQASPFEPRDSDVTTDVHRTLTAACLQRLDKGRPTTAMELLTQIYKKEKE